MSFSHITAPPITQHYTTTRSGASHPPSHTTGCRQPIGAAFAAMTIALSCVIERKEQKSFTSKTLSGYTIKTFFPLKNHIVHGAQIRLKIPRRKSPQTKIRPVLSMNYCIKITSNHPTSSHQLPTRDLRKTRERHILNERDNKYSFLKNFILNV